jgi:hypothetical protein
LYPALNDFLVNQFEQAYKRILEKSKEHWPGHFDVQLSKTHQLLSPSDFGFHNAFQTRDGLKFIDFEYFGWDDPVKLTCDFILHPGMDLSDEQKKLWLCSIKDIFIADRSFKQRFVRSYSLYGLCWCLIQLNIFNIDEQKKKHIKTAKNHDFEKKQAQQLKKSKKLLNHLNEVHKYGLPQE